MKKILLMILSIIYITNVYGNDTKNITNGGNDKLLGIMFSSGGSSDASIVVTVSSATIRLEDDLKSIKDNTLVGIMYSINKGILYLGGEINHIIVKTNDYDIQDIDEAMIHIGANMIDKIVLYGSIGKMYSSRNNGDGYGIGLNYQLIELITLSLNHKSFRIKHDDMPDRVLFRNTFALILNF